MQINDLYKAALTKWGWRSQTDMVEEECAELILALKRLKRGRGGYDDVRQEIADVEIMCGQMREMTDKYTEVGEKTTDEWKTFKLARLEGRVYDGHAAEMGIIAN